MRSKSCVATERWSAARCAVPRAAGRWNDLARARVRTRRSARRIRRKPIDAALGGLGDPRRLTVADVGAGTGISARLFAERGCTGHSDRAQRADARGRGAASAASSGATATPSGPGSPMPASMWSWRARPFTGSRRRPRWKSFGASRAGAPRCCNTSATSATRLPASTARSCARYATDDTEALRRDARWPSSRNFRARA